MTVFYSEKEYRAMLAERAADLGRQAERGDDPALLKELAENCVGICVGLIGVTGMAKGAAERAERLRDELKRSLPDGFNHV